MLDIKQEHNQIIVADTFCFTDKASRQGEYVTLALQCGEDVKYGQPNIHYIDYPGEYQQDSMIIICVMSKDNKLNYVIKSLNNTFAFVQDSKAVNADSFEGVTDVIAYGENVWTQLQKLDLQCNIISL